MIAQLFQPDLLLIINKGKLQDENDYFTALYNRQESWGNPIVDKRYLGKYTPDRNSGSMKTRSFPMDTLGASWDEFQAWIDTAYGLAKFIAGWQANLSAADFSYYLSAAGIYKRPVGVTSLIATNGTVLATGLITDLQWETSYNALLVPYERARTAANAPLLPYIKNLAQFGEAAGFFRQCTLKFDGTGL